MEKSVIGIEDATISGTEENEFVSRIINKHLAPKKIPVDLPIENFAKQTCDRLVRIINEFEATLVREQQAGVRLATFGNQVFSIENITFHNPDIIILVGTSQTGEPVQLVQHVTQVNLLLVAVPRKDDVSKPRRKLGFEHPTQESQQD